MTSTVPDLRIYSMQNFRTSWGMGLIRTKLHYRNLKPRDYHLHFFTKKIKTFGITQACSESWS